MKKICIKTCTEICTKIFITACFLFCFVGCFDYYENIKFRKDFSGTVHIRYTVPIFGPGLESESKLSFLPSTREGIQKQYEKILSTKKAMLRNLKIVPVEAALKSDESSKIQVSYEIAFQNPKVLEDLPLTNIKVIRKYRRIEIHRSFPSAERTVKNIFIERILEHFQKKLGSHSLHYTTQFPQGFRISSNKGRFIKKTRHVYSVPLKSTLDPGNESWALVLEEK